MEHSTIHSTFIKLPSVMSFRSLFRLFLNGCLRQVLLWSMNSFTCTIVKNIQVNLLQEPSAGLGPEKASLTSELIEHSVKIDTHSATIQNSFEPQHEISKNVVCASSKASDQPAQTHRLIRAFASRLNIL